MTLTGLLRKCNGMNPLKGCLKGRSGRRRILQIRGRIIAVIDSRKNVIRLSRNNIKDTDSYTIRRGSVAGVSMNPGTGNSHSHASTGCLKEIL